MEKEDIISEIATNLMASLCCGSDLPENDCTYEEIYAAVNEAYDIGMKLMKDKLVGELSCCENCRYHAFWGDELKCNLGHNACSRFFSDNTIDRWEPEHEIQ